MSTFIAAFGLAASIASSSIAQIDYSDPKAYDKLSSLTEGDTFTYCARTLPDTTANMPDTLPKAVKQQLRDAQNKLQEAEFNSLEQNWNNLQRPRSQEPQTRIIKNDDQSDAKRAEAEKTGKTCRTYSVVPSVNR